MITQRLKISLTVIKILAHPPDPLGGVKGQILNCAITQSVGAGQLVFFTKILHADRGTINMKNVKREFS